MREKIKLTRKDGQDLAYGGRAGGYEVIDNSYKIIGHSRWSVRKRALIRDPKDNSVYFLDYSIGATECQDESPFEYSDPVLVPAVLETVQEWVEEVTKIVNQE